MTSIVGKNCWSRVAGGLLVALALLTAGCYKATGGGWIPSLPEIGAGKANFGFNARCVDTQENGLPAAKLYDGQLEWQDGPVSLHGVVGPEPFFVTLPGQHCKDFRGLFSSQQFVGIYNPQPGGASGIFIVTVTDGGEPGNINGDLIDIQLVDGLYNGYFNAGVIQGGNIQVF
jgi:hypothetical protein